MALCLTLSFCSLRATLPFPASLPPCQVGLGYQSSQSREQSPAGKLGSETEELFWKRMSFLRRREGGGGRNVTITWNNKWLPLPSPLSPLLLHSCAWQQRSRSALCGSAWAARLLWRGL